MMGLYYNYIYIYLKTGRWLETGATLCTPTRGHVFTSSEKSPLQVATKGWTSGQMVLTLVEINTGNNLSNPKRKI